MVTATMMCSVCGSNTPHEPASETCGVYRWFRAGKVRPIDLEINLGLVIDLLRAGNCAVEDGQIKRRDHYDAGKAGWREYSEARREMIEALTAAEQSVMDAAADEIIARLGAAPVLADPANDYRVMSPAGSAMNKRSIFRETFGQSVNWTGGTGRMFAALRLMQQHIAVGLQATADLSDKMVAEINGRNQRQRQWAVESSQQIVDQVANALWRLQYDRVQDIVDRMYVVFAEEIRQIIGVAAYVQS